MADKSDEGSTPPYVSYKTFKTLLRMIAPAMPSRIDKHVMPTFSGANQNQVIQALKYLGLIDELGIPTKRLRDLVGTLEHPDAFQEAMFDMLDTAYPFTKTFEHTTGTDGQLNEAFASVASGDTIRKCKSFWLAAMKDAGAILSPYIKEPGKRGPSPGGKRSGRPAKEKAANLGANAREKAPPPPASSHFSGVHPALVGMLQELPKPGTQWSTGQKDAFVKAFRSILDVVYS